MPLYAATAAPNHHLATPGALFPILPAERAPLRLSVAPAAPPGDGGRPKPPGAASGPPSQAQRARAILARLTPDGRIQDELADLVAAASGPPTADGSVCPVAWAALVELGAAMDAMDMALDGVREALGPESGWTN